MRVSEKVEKQPGLAERRHPQRKTFNGEEEGEEPAEPGRAEGEELRGWDLGHQAARRLEMEEGQQGALLRDSQVLLFASSCLLSPGTFKTTIS